MTPVVIPTFFSLPVLAKHRFTAPAINWQELPAVFRGFREEQEYERKLVFSDCALDERPADLGYLRRIHFIRDGGRSLQSVIPHEETLSSILELAIKEAVGIDRGIIYQAYLKMEQEETNPLAGFVVALPIKFKLFGHEEQVLRSLAQNEVSSDTLRRAKLSALILEKVLEHKEASKILSVD